MFLVITRHNQSGEPDYVTKPTMDEAAKEAHKILAEYGFEMRAGKPFDEGNDDGYQSGFNCFDEVETHTCADGTHCVIGFVHCEGDGPVLEVRKV